jgi:glycosyltransferase involved in cell wall biosynthesis
VKLVYVINSLGSGGSEHSLAEMIPHYVAHGVHPTIVALRSKEVGVESRLRAMGCDIRVLRNASLRGRALELRRILGEERAPLVHTTLFEADVVGRLAAAGTGVPVLSSLVNTAYEPVRLADPNVGRFRLRVVRAVDALTARHLAAHFHAVTRAVKESSVRALGLDPARVTVIERGRDPARFDRCSQDRVRARERLGLRPDEEVVLNVGRHEFQKGQRHLVEAFAALARARPRLVVLVAGRPGHATAGLNASIRAHGLGDRFRLVGHREDLPEVLAAADLFVLPSLYEGCSGAVIEAMAAGLPVVASDIPGMRELVEPGRSGLLVPPGAPAALARSIRRLLEDRREAAGLAERSRRIFLERFTIQRSAGRMLRLYERLSSDAGRVPEATAT